MTVPATTRRAGPFNGNGSTTAFPFTFKVFSQDDIQVVLADADGIETTQTLTTDYTVAVNVDQDTSPGGTVTMLAAPATGETLVIAGAVDYDQTLDIPAGGNFSPRAIENALDRTVIQVQQVAEESGRALKLPVTSDADPELPAPAANKIIGWNDTATGLVNRDATDLATAIAYADWTTDTFEGDGTTRSFALAADPGSIHNCDVNIDGVSQTATADFTLSGRILTFVSAPPDTSAITVRYGQALPVGTTPTATTNWRTDKFSGNGSTTEFTLTTEVLGEDYITVAVNGLLYAPTYDFTVAGDTLTFIAAPPAPTDGEPNILVRYGREISADVADAANVSYTVTGGVARSQASKNAEFVSVKDFGAKGDGVTDDTAAIQGAIDYAEDSGILHLIFPSGGYVISDTLTITAAGMNVVGAGRGGGGASNSSVYKKSPCRLLWAGTGTKHMIAINPGAWADVGIKWGGKLQGFSLFGNGVAGVSGVNCGPKTANWVYRDIEIHGVDTGWLVGQDAYACTWDNCGVYEYNEYGWDCQGDNHNGRWIACQMQYCALTNPSGGVIIRGDAGGESTGLSFIGCDFEPNDAQNFLWLRDASGVTVSGCYFEARSASTQQFIRLGETTVATDKVIGCSIIGNTFQGAGYAREAIMLQNAASGLEISGNHAYGFTGSFVNNSSPGIRNHLGQNWLSSTPATFVGGKTGFENRTSTRLSSNSSAITSSTSVLDHTHTVNNQSRTRLVMARVAVQITDAVASNVSTTFSLQKYDGVSSWATLGAFVRAQGYVNAGTSAIISQVLTLEELDTSESSSARYRVLVSPGSDDSVVVLEGSSISVQELAA